MPHTRSAKKQLRKNQKRRLRNRATVKSIKTQLKKVEATSAGGSLDDLRKQYDLANLDFAYKDIGRLLDEWQSRLEQADV